VLSTADARGGITTSGGGSAGRWWTNCSPGGASSFRSSGRTFAPRCIKDLVEERLFAARRTLFTDLSVVFMDTTSLYFEGRGGESLGERGHSKDYRPQLNQMILGVVIDQQGRPVCSEMWPGDTADVTALIPVIDRLRWISQVSRQQA
jgi:hypothetical protein